MDAAPKPGHAIVSTFFGRGVRQPRIPCQRHRHCSTVTDDYAQLDVIDET